MLTLDEMWMTQVIDRAGFEVVVRTTGGADGATRCNLAGRGPYGAFFVSAPTESDAFRAAVDHVRCRMIPMEPRRRGGY